MPLQSPNSTKKGQSLDSKNLQQTDEILNSILPPRLFDRKKIIVYNIILNELF